MIALVGDIHGRANALRDAAAHVGVSAVVQLGDFHLKPSDVPNLGVPLYWIEGNHERWPLIGNIGHRVVREFAPMCYYVPRGVVLPLEGRRYLCAGGADSVDRAYQERFGAWSVCEQWTDSDVDACLAAERVDTILTHSPPQTTIDAHFDPLDLERYFGLPRTWRSPVAAHVESVWTRHGQPPLYCGHMHRAVTDGSVRILGIDEVVLIPAHPEEKCEKCGGPNVTWFAPNELWNLATNNERHVIWCPVCFVKAAEAAGVTAVWSVAPEGAR